MNRIDRLLGVLTVIQSKQYVSAEYIAQKYEISIRTVYRDIKALVELGIPVSFENQKGYFIMQGYFLPPVSFTNEEANALILMASLAEKFADNSIVPHCETAVNKVKSVLRTNQKNRVDHLHSQIRVYRSVQESSQQAFLAEIQNAISHRYILEMEYRNLKQEISRREVEPIGLVFYSNDWHMIAWCTLREEYRDFKVVRIQQLSNSRTPFQKEPHIDINDYIRSLGERSGQV